MHSVVIGIFVQPPTIFSIRYCYRIFLLRQQGISGINSSEATIFYFHCDQEGMMYRTVNYSGPNSFINTLNQSSDGPKMILSITYPKLLWVYIIMVIWFGTPAILGEYEVIKSSFHKTVGQVIMLLNVELDGPGGYTNVSTPWLLRSHKETMATHTHTHTILSQQIIFIFEDWLSSFVLSLYSC